jgi:two-component system, sensor histidine kinase YesM
MRKSLSGKLFVSFLTVIVLSLSMVGFISYFQASNALDKSSEKSIAQVIRSASYQTDLYLQNYEKASDSILSYYQVKQFLDMDPEDSYSYYQYNNDIQKYLFRSLFILYPQISLMYIINEHGKAISDDNSNQAYSTQFDPLERYRVLSSQAPDSGRIAILNTNVKNERDPSIVSMVRKIRGVSSYRPNGILAIEFKAAELARIWEPLDLGQGGFFFILDEFGELLYRPEGAAGEELPENLIASVFSHPNESHMDSVNGEEYMFVSRKSEYSKWQLVVSMPVSELRKPISTIRTTTLLVGALTLAGTLLLATRFGRSITKPIMILKEGMRETEKGNWLKLNTDDRQDELGGLMRSYNLMVTRLSEMIERVYEAELTTQKAALELQETRLERHQAEFQALQLQINPHFLYNTLETIKCYAVVQDSDEITEMVEAMAFMLRYSIQTNLEEITIANELRHVLSYMTILKHRIDRDFEIDVVIPPGLLLEKTVRLTLQPLIENIFQHAFPDGIEDRHRIRIDARIEGDRFLVIVEDNGAGMSTERLAKLREKLDLNQLADTEGDSLYHRGGIGLMNVHRRIQMVFGEQYGLSVESEEHQGTRMILFMPAERRPNRLKDDIKL